MRRKVGESTADINSFLRWFMILLFQIVNQRGKFVRGKYRFVVRLIVSRSFSAGAPFKGGAEAVQLLIDVPKATSR